MQHKHLTLALAAALGASAAGLAPAAPADRFTPLAGGATVTEIDGIVQTINTETRQMTIRTPEGRFEVIDIPREVKRIDAIKVGDRVQATSTEAVLVDLETGPNAGSMGAIGDTTVAPEPGVKPAGTITDKLKLYGKVLKVDRGRSRVTIRGAQETVTLKVNDKALMKRLKLGDGVVATYVRIISGKVSVK
jgi:hypothetical protein